MNHFVVRCSCGTVLTQCRCPGLGTVKKLLVQPDACGTCQARQLNEFIQDRFMAHGPVESKECFGCDMDIQRDHNVGCPSRST